jgi:adenylate kinase
MQVSLSEAYGAYDERCIVQLKSESSDDVDANVARIVAWVEQWRKERSEEDEADGAEGTEAQESE